MDWDLDGKKDIVTGERNGTIRIYLNTGTDASPVFSGYTFLKLMTGANYDCGYTSVPALVDWNNDGARDVLCGEDSGRVELLINIGTTANPSLISYGYIKDGAVNIDVGSRNSPTVFDFDRDGKKDLVIGETYGGLRFYKNKGTDAAPVFNGFETMEAGGENIDMRYYSRPDCVDWDNDGVVDIISGSYQPPKPPTGYIYYFQAIGPMSFTDNKISGSTGGSIGIYLDAGLANAGRTYMIAGSVTGTEPGMDFPGGAHLPLNWDFFSTVVLSLINTPTFDNFMGTLGNTGQAKATFDTLGPVPQAVGVIVNFAYVLDSPINYASNGGYVEIVP